MPQWVEEGIKYTWDQIMMKVGNGHWTLEKAAKVTAMDPKKFLMRTIMTASQMKGDPVGNAANRAIKVIQAQRAAAGASKIPLDKFISKGKAASNAAKASNAVNAANNAQKLTQINKINQASKVRAAQQTIVKKSANKLTKKYGQQTIVRGAGQQATKIITRAGAKTIVRSLGIKIVGGLIAGATIVGTIFFVGSLAYDGYQLYQGTKQPQSEEQVADTESNNDGRLTVTDYGFDDEYFKLYKDFSKVSKSDDWGAVFEVIWLADIEFKIDENGKATVDFKKTYKEGGLKVTVKAEPSKDGKDFLGAASKLSKDSGYVPPEQTEQKAPDLIKDYSGSGSYDYKTKKLTLEFEGTTRESATKTSKGSVWDVSVEAEGRFNGNNFTFDKFYLISGSSRTQLKGWKGVFMEGFEK